MKDPLIPAGHDALLRQQMEQMALILQTMAEGVSIFDGDNNLLFANQGFMDMYSFPPELNQPGTPINHFSLHRLKTLRGLRGEELEQALAKRNKAITKEVGGIESAQIENLADGRIVEVRRRRTSDGFLISTYVDISERVNSEQALKDSEERYKAILEDQTELISRLDADFNLTFANMAYQKTYLKDPENETVIGRNILTFIPDQAIRDDYKKKMRSLTPKHPIVRSVLQEHVVDGSLQWQSWIDRALFDDAGEIVGYQSAGRDITAEKQAEMALAASSQERLAIVNGAIDAIITFDDEGRIREFNPAAEIMFGYTSSMAARKTVADLLIPERDREKYAGSLEAYLRDTVPGWDEGRRVELEVRDRNGRRIPVELAVVDASGDESILYVAYLRDLTEQKEMQAEMVRQQEAITQTEKMGALGSLLANVAHELNNPLAVVIGQADILSELGKDETVLMRTGRIKTAADKCAKIVKTFLAAARQKPPESKPFAASAPADESLELVEYGLKTSGIAFEYKIAESLPPLFGDSSQIGQVLANLLINGQQALLDSPVPRRAVFDVRLSKDGTQVVYDISDNGNGIPDEIRDRIFEPFFTTKAEGSGTGIGLAIAHNIVTAHGGTLSVSDKPRLGGATFELRLPAYTGPEVADSAPDREDDRAKNARIRILVVDDEEDVAETIADHLVIAGYMCEVADGGASALDLMAVQSFDVILSDIRMPDLDGPAFFAEAASKWPGTERQFGFFTGDSLSPAASKFLQHTDLPMIEKPFTRTGLQSLIEEVLARNS